MGETMVNLGFIQIENFPSSKDCVKLRGSWCDGTRQGDLEFQASLGYREFKVRLAT